MKKKKLDSKEIGLEVGLLIGRYFLNSDDLHYGYWKPDIPVDLLHCAEAQKTYSDLLIKQIPENAKSILDVGSGSGNTAKKLIDRGNIGTLSSDVPGGGYITKKSLMETYLLTTFE